MKRVIFVSSLLFCLQLATAQKKNAQYEQYVLNYNKVAVKNMKKYGVPASITLAQGILESAAGKSYLAKKANNHFGIKCHNDWNGRKVYRDDDRKGECFRRYGNPKKSFRDHSAFLSSRSRYASLFNLPVTDYQAWAKGLKKAGYATDINYTQKIIRIIETYDLDFYDMKGRKAAARKQKQRN